LQVVGEQFGEVPLADVPGHHVVVIGELPPLSVGAARVAVGGDREGGHGLAAGRVAHLRVAREPADQHHPVKARHRAPPPPARSPETPLLRPPPVRRRQPPSLSGTRPRAAGRRSLSFAPGGRCTGSRSPARARPPPMGLAPGKRKLPAGTRKGSGYSISWPGSDFPAGESRRHRIQVPIPIPVSPLRPPPASTERRTDRA